MYTENIQLLKMNTHNTHSCEIQYEQINNTIGSFTLSYVHLKFHYNIPFFLFFFFLFRVLPLARFFFHNFQLNFEKMNRKAQKTIFISGFLYIELRFSFSLVWAYVVHFMWVISSPYLACNNCNRREEEKQKKKFKKTKTSIEQKYEMLTKEKRKVTSFFSFCLWICGFRRKSAKEKRNEYEVKNEKKKNQKQETNKNKKNKIMKQNWRKFKVRTNIPAIFKWRRLPTTTYQIHTDETKTTETSIHKPISNQAYRIELQ